MKLNIALLAGGPSGEHEISLKSAHNIHAALMQTEHSVCSLAIDTTGRFFYCNQNQPYPQPMNFQALQEVWVLRKNNQTIVIDTDGKTLTTIDLFFPALHGPAGEDGAIQGWFEWLNTPYVGCGVLASASAMDKALTKTILRQAGINVAKEIILTSPSLTYQQATTQLGTTHLFVKPANMGSSLGVSEVTHADQWTQALTKAFALDSKVLIEEAINGRELEVAVLGNQDPIASLPGEVVSATFYDYNAKYLNSDAAKVIMPAPLDKTTTTALQKVACQAHQALGCTGLSRVDFFLTNNDHHLMVNEINTLPGFTDISMYPKLMELSGIDRVTLMNKLIELALDIYKKRQAHQLPDTR